MAKLPSSRLLRELALSKNEDINIKYYPKGEDDLTNWTAEIRCSPDSAYADFVLCLSIKFPIDYPTKPPIIKFNHQVWHPNVKLECGSICVDILKDAWSPVLTLNKVLFSICLLLDNPNPSSALNSIAARQIEENLELYKIKVKEVCLMNCKKI
jgi:ubiquitin-protein ligase